jgi:hypothetical protein
MSDPDHYVDNSAFDEDELLSVAADKAGNFVLAYFGYDYGASYGDPCTNHGCIFTKRRESSGALAPATFVVGDPRINVYYGLYENQTANPELAADGEGSFVVAWEGYDFTDLGGGDYVIDEGVFARRLVNIGQSNGGVFRANLETDYYQGDAGELDVAADDLGNFVIVWYDEGDPNGIIAQQFDKNKNRLGAEIFVDPANDDPHVAQLPDGTFMAVWGDGGIEGRVFDSSGAAVGPSFEVSPSGKYPEIAASAAGTFIVVFEDFALDDAVGVVFDDSGTAISNPFTVKTSTAFGTLPAVAADDAGNFVVAWQSDGNAYAQRFEMTPATPQAIPVFGKSLSLTNKLPDDPEKAAGKWKASDVAIVAPLRGTASDPRCNGDPLGTVKATVRFSSMSSGHDTGVIPLPCEGWTATGPKTVAGVAKRGYKYKDSPLANGPCNSISVVGTKSLTVSCKGKVDVRQFPYDLVPGTGEGVVKAVLELGLYTYCSEFSPFDGKDGSDGLRFSGRDAPAPASCP